MDSGQGVVGEKKGEERPKEEEVGEPQPLECESVRRPSRSTSGFESSAKAETLINGINRLPITNQRTVRTITCPLLL
jgi:hypothetical protein